MTDKDELTAKVQFKIADHRVQMDFALPTGTIRPRQLLPIMQDLTNAVVSIAERRETKGGRSISCAAGCGTCCRQLVPIAPSEAHHIAELIEAMPEPRRTQIRARFTVAAERLTAAGLIEDLRHTERIGNERVTDFGLSYFKLGIACPFLEQESCSIHVDRPLACREFLVTSAPSHCAEPEKEHVEAVHLNAKVSRVLQQMDGEASGAPTTNVPLILAPEWASNHPDAATPRPGAELLRDFIERLTGQKLPASG